MTLKKVIQFPIFESRWVLWVFYIGLVVIQCGYCVKFCEDIAAALAQYKQTTREDWLIIVLGFLDMAMIANLICMIVRGSYQSFIERLPGDVGEKFSSSDLKVKMATSLIVVSGINLLKSAVDIPHVPLNIWVAQGVIHLIFVASAVGLGFINYLHQKNKESESNEKHHA